MTTRRSPRASRGRILFVANTDWYLYNFRKNLLAKAQSQGWQVRFASPRGEYFERLEALGYTGHAVTLDSVGLNPVRELRTLITLARVFRETRPSVVHLFTLKCVLYGCLAAPFASNAQFIGAVTGMGHLFTTRSWRTRLLKTPVLMGLKIALRTSRAHLIFQNTADQDEFIQSGLIAPCRTSVIRGSGVDCEHFKPAQRDSDGPLRILFCGRLIKEKGIREYLQATAQLRANGYIFESRIAGAPYPGNPSSLTPQEVAELKQGTGHEFLGHLEDMAQLFSQTDIVVLPTYREGTPKALLEAAACGCIIITTDIPGCQGIVDPGENGALSQPRDTNAIAQAMQSILDSNPTQRQAMSRYSRQVAVERFSDQNVNRKTLEQYSSEQPS